MPPCDSRPDPRRVADGTLTICLLGGFRVVAENGGIPLPCGSRSAALLTALALRERFRASTECLLGALWPDEPEDGRARSALSTLVADVRKRFRPVLHGDPVIVTTPDGYGLNTARGVAVDATRFASLAEEGERCHREGRTDRAVELWSRAVALYTGDLCAGEDLRAVIERERLRSLHQSSLLRLAEHSYARGDHVGALRHAYRLLEHDPCCEQAHRLLMRCYARLGRRPLALRQYKTCERILSLEYQASPEAATRALYDELRGRPPGADCPTRRAEW